MITSMVSSRLGGNSSRSKKDDRRLDKAGSISKSKTLWEVGDLGVAREVAEIDGAKIRDGRRSVVSRRSKSSASLVSCSEVCWDFTDRDEDFTGDLVEGILRLDGDLDGDLDICFGLGARSLSWTRYWGSVGVS